MKESKPFFCLWGILVVAGIWQLAASWSALPLIPPPGKIIAHVWAIFIPQIAVHSLYSLGRIAAGVFLAAAAGIALGLCLGYFPCWDKRLSPLIYLAYPIPKIALLPIIMLLLGLGEVSKIFMIFLIVVFQVIVAVRDGVRSIPKETYYPLYSLGAGFFTVCREILIPASLPKILTALRVAMGTAIAVLFFTETFGTTFGMGYYIMDAWMRVNYLEMYSGIVVLSGMGLLLFGFVDYLEKKVCGWQYK